MKPDEFICLSVWKKQNEFMTHDEYKKDALNTLDIILKNEFQFIITDNRETRFKFDDDLDVWYRTHFFGQIIQKSQLKRFAIVLNESLRLSAMVEDLFEDITLEHKAFTTLEEAYKWVRRPFPKKRK